MLRVVAVVVVQVLDSVREQVAVRVEVEAAVLVLLLVSGAVSQFRRALLRVEPQLLRVVKSFSLK